MPYIIAEPCIDTKDSACVEVCPVDCIYEGPDQFYIHPDECIDCGACVPECPVEAIFLDEDVPADQQDFIPLNADLAMIWKPITRTRAPLPDADAWAKVSDKRAELLRDAPGSGKAEESSAESPAAEESA